MSTIFVFLGLLFPGTDVSIGVLKNRLEEILKDHFHPVEFTLKEEAGLLSLQLHNPKFRFHISFVRNEHALSEDWKELAENFNLPWKKKPIDRIGLSTMYMQLEQEGWTQYKSFQNMGYIILEEMQRFKEVTVYTIPSL